MNAPLTMQVALTFGVVGVLVALVADVLPRRPSTPPDWDPYRWQLWQKRVWPEQPIARELSRAGIAAGFGAIDAVRATISDAKGQLAARARRLAQFAHRTLRNRSLAGFRKAHGSIWRNANV